MLNPAGGGLHSSTCNLESNSWPSNGSRARSRRWHGAIAGVAHYSKGSGDLSLRPFGSRTLTKQRKASRGRHTYLVNIAIRAGANLLNELVLILRIPPRNIRAEEARSVRHPPSRSVQPPPSQQILSCQCTAKSPVSPCTPCTSAGWCPNLQALSETKTKQRRECRDTIHLSQARETHSYTAQGPQNCRQTRKATHNSELRQDQRRKHDTISSRDGEKLRRKTSFTRINT